MMVAIGSRVFEGLFNPQIKVGQFIGPPILVFNFIGPWNPYA